MAQPIPGFDPTIQGFYFPIVNAPKPSGNTCVVDTDPDTGRCRVNLNGGTYVFPPEAEEQGMFSFNYYGAAGGGDTFRITFPGINATVVVHGGKNTVHGGPGWLNCQLHGDFNRCDNEPGAGGYVFSYSGPNDSIDTSNGLKVTSYSADPQGVLKMKKG